MKHFGCLWEYQVSDGVCLGCVLWVWKVRWVPRHALVAIEGLPVASRVIRGVRGGGGARGARSGEDHAGVCPRGGIGLIPFGGAILQPQRCHSRSGKPWEGLFTSYAPPFCLRPQYCKFSTLPLSGDGDGDGL